MTIDDLAIAVEREFEIIHANFDDVHREIASLRGEFIDFKNEMIDFKNQILLAIESIDVHLSAYISRSRDDIANLQEITREHDGRLRMLEKGR